MEAISKWLLHDDQKELFEILFALALNIVFLGLATLLLLALDWLLLALSLAKGSGILWIGIFGTAVLVSRIHGFFGINLYDHSNAYVISNLVVSSFLQMGWAAFASMAVQGFTDGMSVWIVGILYSVTFLSCFITFFAVSSFYRGTIYRLVGLPLALISFILFSMWPASGLWMFGWFFDLF